MTADVSNYMECVMLKSREGKKYLSTLDHFFLRTRLVKTGLQPVHQALQPVLSVILRKKKQPFFFSSKKTHLLKLLIVYVCLSYLFEIHFLPCIVQILSSAVGNKRGKENLNTIFLFILSLEYHQLSKGARISSIIEFLFIL